MLSPTLTSNFILVHLSFAFTFTLIQVGNSHDCNHFPVSLIYATPNVHLFPHLVDANHPSEVKLLPLALSKALKALVSLYSGQTRILRTKAQCENGLLNSLTPTHPETRGPGKLWSSVKPPEERCGVGLISSFKVLAQKFQ